MIRFLREDNMAIWLLFDLCGLNQLIDTFKKVLRGGKESIDALMDMSVVTLKKKSKEMEVSLIVTIGESTLINKQNHQIIWSFKKEDIEDALGRLEHCKAAGHFSPAEFIRVNVPKNKRLDYMYCELKK